MRSLKKFFGNCVLWWQLQTFELNGFRFWKTNQGDYLFKFDVLKDLILWCDTLQDMKWWSHRIFCKIFFIREWSKDSQSTWYVNILNLSWEVLNQCMRWFWIIIGSFEWSDSSIAVCFHAIFSWCIQPNESYFGSEIFFHSLMYLKLFGCNTDLCQFEIKKLK